MNTCISTELKKYIEENQEALVKLTDTLCRIPAPSHHEERRAEFRNLLRSMGPTAPLSRIRSVPCVTA